MYVIIGSTGEMTRRWTRAFNNLRIETHLLIQAIVHPFPSFVASFYYQLEHCLDYMTEHITVNDALVFCHFEEFVRLVADTSRYHSDFQASVRYTLAYMHRRIREHNPSASQSYRNLFSENRMYVLKRGGFERDIPYDPFFFRNEDNLSIRNSIINPSFDTISYPRSYMNEADAGFLTGG